MRYTIVESRYFTAEVYQHFRGDEDDRLFQAYLASHVTAGDVIPGAGGLRKVRWHQKDKGRGKRGGLRVIYLAVPEHARILLLAAYAKSQADDLTAQERQALATLAELYRSELERQPGRKARVQP